MRKTRLNGILGPGSMLMGLLLAAACGPLRASRVRPRAATRAPVEAVTHARVSEAFGKVPLHFEANRGQTDPRVQFLARGGGYTLFLTPTETVLVLTRTEAWGPGDAPTRPGEPDERERTAAVVRMRALGANPEPHVAGQAELPGKANYLRGNDRRKWNTNVATYARVRYPDLYPGIDLIYYGTQGQLEYDFVLAPGADPSRIALGFEGADKIEVDAQGDLVLQTAAGPLRQRKPVLYQDGADGRRAVGGGYVLKGADRVGVQVAAYDRSRPLVIDPVLVYSTYLGGSGADIARGIAADPVTSGIVYVAGETASANFPVTGGSFQPTFSKGAYCFGAKFDTS